MKIAVVAPSSVPFTLGGAERLWNGLVRTINEETGHDAELIKLPTPERNLPDLVGSYQRWSELDVSHFDLVISTKYPAWMVTHANHVVYVQHTLRGLYDTYPRHLPHRPEGRERDLAELTELLLLAPQRDAVPEVFDRFWACFRAHGHDHPAFSFPGPLARLVVHYLDRAALQPPAVRRHLAISATVAARPGYFPPGVPVEVVRHPSDLTGFRTEAFDYFFTASRLDGPKRIDLLVRAMASVPQPVLCKIAGTGPELDRLRALAGRDRRIEFLGYVGTDELVGHYARALAVPFVPLDEDLGLITLEAGCSGKPVITTTDAGGPTELVADGVTGFVTEPSPEALGAAMARLAADRGLARRLGEQARHMAEGVTWRRTVDALVGGLEPPRPRPSRRPACPKLVVTSTFPVHPRQGGGQLRCYHLYGALTERFDVEIVSLTGPGDTPAEIVLGNAMVERVVPKSAAHEEAEARLAAGVGVPITDIAAVSLFELTPAYLTALADASRDADAVLLAHPFLLPAVRRVRPAIPVVYDAHNAEFRLKGDVLPTSPAGRRLLADVVAVERQATAEAVLISSCSVQDADALAARFEVPRERFLEVPNGVAVSSVPFVSGEARRGRSRRWRERWAAVGGCPPPDHVALFSGSWHPPNIDAAEHIIEMAGSLPQVVFVLLGGHGVAFRSWRLPSNVAVLGAVSDLEKNALLAAADVALNPMVRGSGTNLKLVEYFAAGVPVVSTPLGARGLDVVDGVHLLTAPLDEMVHAIEQVLADAGAADRRALLARRTVEERYDWERLGFVLAEAIVGALPPARAAPAGPARR